jgi:hypothetical protein
MSTMSPLICQEGNRSDVTDKGGGKEEPVTSIRAEHEDVKVGVLFASKAITQLIANPFIGPLTNR